MKLSAFASVLALSGLAAVAIAQQPATPTPPKPATAPPPALTSVNGTNASEANLAPDAVVLTIGNQSMTRAQFEVLLSALAENEQPATIPRPKKGRLPNSTPSWKQWRRKRANVS